MERLTSSPYVMDLFGYCGQSALTELAFSENGMNNLKLWKQHGDKATSIMATAVELEEDESDVLLRLYELPTRVLCSTAA